MTKKIEFSNAPVVEVAIGAQFEGSVISKSCIFNLYQEIKDKYPVIEEHPILPSIVEKPEEKSDTRVLAGFHSRQFFVNQSGNKLFQIQPDKILFNWRKVSNDIDYPHFNNVLEEFFTLFNALNLKCGFKEMVNQLEVTYVDHVLLEDFASSNYNVSEIFKSIVLPDNLKSIDCNLTIPLKSINSNLIFKLISAIRNIDKKKLLSCETTCRGMILDGQDIKDWYIKAHSSISDFFINSITEKAKKTWGLKK